MVGHFIGKGVLCQALPTFAEHTSAHYSALQFSLGCAKKPSSSCSHTSPPTIAGHHLLVLSSASEPAAMVWRKARVQLEATIYWSLGNG